HRTGGAPRPGNAGRAQDRHLRGARWRAGVGEVLSPRGHELRVLLAVPRAHRPSRRGSGGTRGAGGDQPDESDSLKAGWGGWGRMGEPAPTTSTILRNSLNL